jgi:hypothetical protein
MIQLSRSTTALREEAALQQVAVQRYPLGIVFLSG